MLSEAIRHAGDEYTPWVSLRVLPHHNTEELIQFYVNSGFRRSALAEDQNAAGEKIAKEFHLKGIAQRYPKGYLQGILASGNVRMLGPQVGELVVGAAASPATPATPVGNKKVRECHKGRPRRAGRT